MLTGSRRGRTLRIGVVGCGTGGPAAALALAADGHAVEVLDGVPAPRPVGAGILLQPTGLAVLGRLGLLDRILALGARVDRLHGTTPSGHGVLDLAYADLRADLFGLGVHRGALFATLHDALAEAGIVVRWGVEVVVRRRAASGAGWVLEDAGGGEHGPYDLVVLADGARSRLRDAAGLVRGVRRYPWGALWAIVADPGERYAGTLAQVYRGTREFLGFLPSGHAPGVAGGAPTVSLFWSLRQRDLPGWHANGLDAWKAQVLTLSERARPVLDALDHPRRLAYAAYHDVRLRRWHADGVAVIGDAGHAMSPQLGQGANLALCDGWELAACIRTAFAAGDGLPAALAAYSDARRGCVRFYANTSRLLTPLFQSGADWLGPPRDRVCRPASRVPVLRRQMLLSLSGAKTGVWRTMPGGVPAIR